jgi:hypothetical protein
LKAALGTEDVWSDFKDGSSAVNYVNGALTGAKTIGDFNMGAEIWATSETFSNPCTVMKATENYKLQSETCSASAKFICTKPGEILFSNFFSNFCF